MDPAAFAGLLHYIYTDSLADDCTAGRVVAAQHLLVAADRYGHRGLKSFIESELCRHNVVGVDTVLPMLALAERHQCWKLKNKCLEFTSSSGATARAVMATDDVEHLARSCPSAVKELVKILEAKERRRRAVFL